MDDNNVGVGAVLQQEYDQDIDCSISYFSRMFDESQRRSRYSTIEKEILVLLLTFKHFDGHLNTTVEPVLVHANHNPIVFIKLIRWKRKPTFIAVEFNLAAAQIIQISQIKGRKNVIGDALSRVN